MPYLEAYWLSHASNSSSDASSITFCGAGSTFSSVLVVCSTEGTSTAGCCTSTTGSALGAVSCLGSSFLFSAIAVIPESKFVTVEPVVFSSFYCFSCIF